MTNITKLAKHINARDNPSPYTPMFGKIISLPELKIRLGTRVLLTKEDIKATFDIYDKVIHDGHTEYVCLNKTVVLLPYSDDNKFIAIGVLEE